MSLESQALADSGLRNSRLRTQDSELKTIGIRYSSRHASPFSARRPHASGPQLRQPARLRDQTGSRRVTGGDIRLGPGTLYEAIQRLEEDGLIEEAPRRRSTVSAGLYRLTFAGRAALRVELRRYTAVLTQARAISPGARRSFAILACGLPAARARLSGVVPPPVPVGARVRVPRRAGRAALCASRRRCTALVDTLLDLRVGVAPTHLRQLIAIVREPHPSTRFARSGQAGDDRPRSSSKVDTMLHDLGHALRLVIRQSAFSGRRRSCRSRSASGAAASSTGSSTAWCCIRFPIRSR